MNRKRSSCASGSGYVPSISIGLSVAITKYGGFERIGHAADGDLQLGHRFEQRRLGLGGGAIDLVAEQDVAEDGPALEAEFAAPVVADRITRVPVISAGIRIDGELDPVEAQIERQPERLDQGGFAGAGNALDQHVAAGEERAQAIPRPPARGRRSLCEFPPGCGGKVRAKSAIAGRFGGDRRRFIHRSNTRFIVISSAAAPRREPAVRQDTAPG